MKKDDVGDSSLPISRVVFGVRYEPQYRVRDSIGRLIDTILGAKGSPFGPDTFPLSEAGAHTHRLVNPETDDSLTITQSDALLDLAMPTTTLGRVVQLAASFDTFVLSPLAEVCAVRNIHRYGMLVRFDDKGVHLMQRPVERYGDKDLPTPREMAIRFVYRLPTEEAYFRSGVDDYRNVIYTMTEGDDGSVRLSLDYQEYFLPSLEADELRKRPFATFAEQGTQYHRKTFGEWVRKLAQVGRAA